MGNETKTLNFVRVFFEEDNPLITEREAVKRRDYDKLLDYFKELNKELRRYSVKEDKRSLFVSGVLIALQEDSFDYEKLEGETARKGSGRIKKMQIKLPATLQGDPDWQFMEDYIKSLPYSKNLI